MTADGEVFREAARIIERDGWYQGMLQNPNGTGYCAMGALFKACGERPVSYFYGLPSRSKRAIQSLSLHVGAEISSWNDDPSRTAEDVILELKRCAEAVEAAS